MTKSALYEERILLLLLLLLEEKGGAEEKFRFLLVCASHLQSMSSRVNGNVR